MADVSLTTRKREGLLLFSFMRPTALALPAKLPFPKWEHLGEVLGLVGRAMTWAIGDWLNYGEAHYGERHAQAIEATGMSPDHLARLAYVASKIDPRRRRSGVPFSVHAEIAKLEPKDQDEWLARAEKKGWRREELRDALKEAGLKKGSKESKQLKDEDEWWTLTLRLLPGDSHRQLDEAFRQGMKRYGANTRAGVLAKWAEETLERWAKE